MELLEQLASGDPETWNEAFRCLYPVAFDAARTRLGDNFSGECEDVAMEALSEILEKGTGVKSEQELKPLTAAIARNKATDRLRRHLSEKRGGNKVQSLEEMVEANAGELPELPHDELVDHLAVQELRELLTDLSADVKKEYRVVLRDHFLDELSYNEIAEKRNISVGSVGVYMQRGLAILRNVIARRPKLEGELLAMISDASIVKVLLPLVSAVQLGGWFFADRIQFRRPQPDESKLSDEEKLRWQEEMLPTTKPLGEDREILLQKGLEKKYPNQWQQWKTRCERERRQLVRRERRERVSAVLLLSAVILILGLVGYGLVLLLKKLF